MNARTTAQNTSATLRHGKPAEEEKDERDIVNKYNINFSIFKSPKNAIEGDILVFPHSNLWFQGRLACRFDTLNDARRSGWKTNRFKVEKSEPLMISTIQDIFRQLDQTSAIGIHT